MTSEIVDRTGNGEGDEDSEHTTRVISTFETEVVRPGS